MVTTFDEMRTRIVKQAIQFLKASSQPITEPLVNAALDDAFVVVLFKSLIEMPAMPKAKALTNDELREAYRLYWRDLEDFEEKQLDVDWKDVLLWRLMNARAN